MYAASSLPKINKYRSFHEDLAISEAQNYSYISDHEDSYSAQNYLEYISIHEDCNSAKNY